MQTELRASTLLPLVLHRICKTRALAALQNGRPSRTSLMNFFLHKVTVRFEPINQFQVVSVVANAASTSANQQFVALNAPIVVYGLQHDQADYADSSNAAQNAMEGMQCKFTNTGRPWVFAWKNVERFDQKGSLGDQTTAATTQSWCQVANVSKLGGGIGVVSLIPTNTTPSTERMIPLSEPFGNVMMTYDVSFRVRS